MGLYSIRRSGGIISWKNNHIPTLILIFISIDIGTYISSSLRRRVLSIF